MIPGSVKKALNTSSIDNFYLKMYKNMRKSLNQVIEGNDTYSSYHYSMLINNFELFLKGFLFQKLNTGEWKEPHPHYLTEDHKIMKLLDQIDKFIPMYSNMTQKDKAEFQKFISGICRQYTTARYSEYVPYEDFLQLNNEVIMPFIEKIQASLLEKDDIVIEFEEGL